MIIVTMWRWKVPYKIEVDENNKESLEAFAAYLNSLLNDSGWIDVEKKEEK